MNIFKAIKAYFDLRRVRRCSRPSRRELIKTIEFLWQIIDNIDTAGDVAKSNDKAFRDIVEKQQKKRWQCGITTDGYKLDLSGIKRA